MRTRRRKTDLSQTMVWLAVAALVVLLILAALPGDGTTDDAS